jgi:4'-phosphopantetheinyl transferase
MLEENHTEIEDRRLLRQNDSNNEHDARQGRQRLVRRRYRAPMPPSGTVEVWIAELSAAPERLLGLLCSTERERARKLLDDRLRLHWCVSRALLRELLARAIGADPAALEFEQGPHGKPRLAPPAGRTPSFNMSHSGELALYAIGWDREVGVDVEVQRSGRSGKGYEVEIARRFLGEPLAQRLQALPAPQRTREFLAAWVAYEARVKCLGYGLGGDSSGSASPRRDGEPWVTPIAVGEGAFAALAVSGGPAAVQIRWWACE